MLLSQARAKLQTLKPTGTDELAQLRARLLAFLLSEGAFATLHDRRTGASLGEHLLGTFDLLATRRCSAAVCAAGALHSIYGTNRFTRATVLPTHERRDAVAALFGRRSEHLAFLFHDCNRPNDLNRGELESRSGVPFAWSARDVRDLRLIEAANLQEQAYPMARWPAIRAAWAAATAAGWALQPAELKPLAYAARMETCARGLRLLGCSPRYVLRLSCAGYSLQVQLPVYVADPRVLGWLWMLLLAAEPALAHQPPAASHIGFVLAGECQFGMPACSVELLNSYRRSACAGYVFEHPSSLLRQPDTAEPHPGVAAAAAAATLEIEPVIRTPAPEATVAPAQPGQLELASLGMASLGMASLGITSRGKSEVGLSMDAIPLAALSPSATASAREATGRALAGQLRLRGWSKVLVGREARDLIAKAYGSMRTLAPALRSGSGMCRRFDGARYVGYGTDAGRVWLNCRAGMADDQRLPWPAHARDERDALAQAFSACEALARTALVALLAHVPVHASVTPDQLLADQPSQLAPVRESAGAPAAELDGGTRSTVADASERLFGSSVQRFLVYADRPPGAHPLGSASSVHADMGLLTLAPPSTISALELLEPASGEVARPESELVDGDWLLFAGETLSFLTGGALQAPLHRVPWVERGAQPPRCAAPFFLRAAPWALLRDPSGARELTCRELMEGHCAAHRPWRLRKRGALAIGDW
jgi:hypothetical protein